MLSRIANLTNNYMSWRILSYDAHGRALMLCHTTHLAAI